MLSNLNSYSNQHLRNLGIFSCTILGHAVCMRYIIPIGLWVQTLDLVYHCLMADISAKVNDGRIVCWLTGCC